ncbi:MAG: glycosyltransferase [Desulfosoma sp.]
MDYGAASELLDAFQRDIEAGTLWAIQNETAHGCRRQDLWAALEALLVWHRPRLEAGPGLDFPYKVLRKTASVLQSQAEKSHDLSSRQAELYLTLLPFSGQWQRLSALEKSGCEEPDVREFFQREKKKITEKIAQKGEKTVRVSHFMQVLKAPREPHEKGVLRIFSLPYLILDEGVLGDLGRRFVLFVEPPMGVIWRHSWWRRFCLSKTPCLFGLAGAEDRNFVATQHNAVPIPLAHGDFLEDLAQPPLPNTRKDFDIVFNATFDDMPRKRHLLMLDLLLKPELSKKKALFLGRGTPENVEAFERAVKERGLEPRVTVRPNVRRLDIPELLSRCRLGVHLSLYENASRAVMEYFRSNIPCVLSSSTAGMNLDMFTDETGAAVPDIQLSQTIASILENPHRYRPRSWFLRESGSLVSTRRLNSRLKTFFHERNLPWTQDIVALTSSGASRYASPKDKERFREEHRWLADRIQPSLPFGFQILP